MKNFIALIVIMASVFTWSCNKDDDGEKPKPSKPFPADTTTIEIAGDLFQNFTYPPRAIAYDTSDNSLYFYAQYNSDGTGYQIIKYNLSSKSLITVYTNSDPTWKNSNGSEGRRLYITGKEMWIPGGATNPYLMKLAIGTNTLYPNLMYDIGNILFGNKAGSNPYDMVMHNSSLITLSMDDFVFYGKYNGSVTNTGNFNTGNTSHGSSISVVTIDSVDHFLVKCGYDATIELRKSNGMFVRSVSLNASNYSQLVVDSKSRVYCYDSQQQKFYRYSADLLNREEFYVDFCSESMGFALREDIDHITIFAGYNSKGLGMVRFPK